MAQPLLIAIPDSERSLTEKTDDNIERVRPAFDKDHRLAVRNLENKLGIAKNSISNILTEELPRIFLKWTIMMKIHASCDFWLFSRLKMPLKGHRFDEKLIL